MGEGYGSGDLADLHLHELMVRAKQAGISEDALRTMNKDDVIAELERRGVSGHGGSADAPSGEPHLHEVVERARQAGMDERELEQMNKAEIVAELERRGVTGHGGR